MAKTQTGRTTRRGRSPRGGSGALTALAWTSAAAVWCIAAFALVAPEYLSPPGPERVVVGLDTDPIMTGSLDRNRPGDTDFRKELEGLRRDLAGAVKATVALRGENRRLSERVAALEYGLGDVTGSVTVAERGDRQAPAPEPAETTIKVVDLPEPAVPQAEENAPPARSPPPIEPPVQSPTEKAEDTVDTPPVSAPKVASRSDFAIDLGPFASLRALQSAWRTARDDNEALLGRLSPRALIRDGIDGIQLRLVAGPFKNAAAAADLCARLKTKGLRCTPSLFAGQPFQLASSP